MGSGLGMLHCSEKLSYLPAYITFTVTGLGYANYLLIAYCEGEISLGFNSSNLGLSILILVNLCLYGVYACGWGLCGIAYMIENNDIIKKKDVP